MDKRASHFRCELKEIWTFWLVCYLRRPKLDLVVTICDHWIKLDVRVQNHYKYDPLVTCKDTHHMEENRENSLMERNNISWCIITYCILRTILSNSFTLRNGTKYVLKILSLRSSLEVPVLFYIHIFPLNSMIFSTGPFHCLSKNPHWWS
jgi:hypothetical protein